VTALRFGAVSSQGFISLAIMTAAQLTLVQVSTTKSLRLHHSAKLLLTGCHPTHSLGAASIVVSLGSVDDVSESFAIVCRPKSTEFACTPTSQSSLLGMENTPDAFTQETAAITNSTNSFFSPTLVDRQSNANKLIQELPSTDTSNSLIEQTVSATLKELQNTALDEVLHMEKDSSKATPDKKIVDITEECVNATAEVTMSSADSSEPALSPLMGLALADGETSRDQSALMTSLLYIPTETPMVGRGSASLQDAYPDQTSHMILARVEYVGKDSQMKVSPMAVSFPEKMDNLEVLSIRPLTVCPSDSVNSPNAGGNITFDDLMFSPSPGKMMSPAANGSVIEVPELSIVCKSADSKQFYCFVLSSRDGKTLHVESEVQFDLNGILSQSLSVPIKALSLKGLALVKVTTKRDSGRSQCSNNIRMVLSGNKTAAEEGGGSPKPINLSLQEDGTVFILNLSCTVPLGNGQVNRSLETPAHDGRIVSPTTNETAIEGTLQAILSQLVTFEKEVYRRMDTMQDAIRENTERVEELEATLLKGSPHNQASF